LIAITGVLAIAVGIITGLAILRGFIFSQLWSWFIVPYFHQPEMSIPLAIGLCLLASIFLPHRSDNKEGLTTFFIAPLVVWGMAWIVKFFL
jgi:hypothetical protein